MVELAEIQLNLMIRKRNSSSRNIHQIFQITNPSKPLKISIPIQFLFAHKGGQNTLDTTSMFTRFNGALGLSWSTI